jgi:hypothetical protein
VTYLIPTVVVAYIQRHGLYAPDKTDPSNPHPLERVPSRSTSSLLRQGAEEEALDDDADDSGELEDFEAVRKEHQQVADAIEAGVTCGSM